MKRSSYPIMAWLKVPCLLFLILILMGCSAGKEVRESGDEVRRFLSSYYDVFSERDWNAFEDCFWEGANMTTKWPDESSGEVEVISYSIPVFLEQTDEGPDSQPVFEEKMTDSDIEVKGDLATAWVRYEARFGSPGELMEWTGTDLFCLMKHEGSWKIVSLTFQADEE